MRFHRRLAARPMSGRKTAGTVAVVVGLSLGLTPNAAADEYTDTDTEFIGGVSRGLNNVVVDKQMIDQFDRRRSQSLRPYGRGPIQRDNPVHPEQVQDGQCLSDVLLCMGGRTSLLPMAHQRAG